MRKQTNAKKYALTAVLSALACALMLLTNFIDTASLSVAAIAALPVLILLCEHGTAPAVGCYAVTSTLSLIVCPLKSAPIAFAAFFGIYPLIKRLAESKTKITRVLIKGGAMLITVGTYTATALVFFPEEIFTSPIYKWIFVPVCIVAFLLYDRCLTLFVRVYALRLRPKIAKYL